MVNRPDVFPEWALQDRTDLNTNLPNVADIPPIIQQYGAYTDMALPRQLLNKQFRLIHDWIKYLDQERTISQSMIGDTLPTSRSYIDSKE